MRRGAYFIGRQPVLAGGPKPARPRAYWEDEEDCFEQGSVLPYLTVFETELAVEERFTGILDPRGAPIMVNVVLRDPIGYLWHDDEGNLRPRDQVLAEWEGSGDGSKAADGADVDDQAGDELVE